MINLPEWTKNLAIYEVNIRQFSAGGTFEEFEQHLSRISNLGFGIIWFMPIQPIGKLNRKGELGSYYSISDYTAVHPDYGTLADFKKLVDKIHQMGMYVILDWVANHTSWDNVWIDQHPEYYEKDSFGNIIAPNHEWTDVAKLDYNHPATRTAQREAMKFWVKEANIDGFRCDMAHLVPTEFWDNVRTELEHIKPVFMLAESENHDLIENAFNAIYSWKLMHLVNEIGWRVKSAYDLADMVKSEVADFPKNSARLLFTSNHDENAWNGSAVERLGCALESANILMFTLNGIPMIMGGQEAGLNHRLKFFEKDEIQWRYDKLQPFYHTLCSLKRRNPALWCGEQGGSYTPLQCDSPHDVFAFCRKKNSNKVVVVLNLSPFDQSVMIKGNILIGKYIDIFSGEEIEMLDEQHFWLLSWSYKVLEAK
jgi:glycosidase